jgi:hypothetical protein
MDSLGKDNIWDKFGNESTISKREKMNTYKQMLDEQINSRHEEFYMTETEKRLNKNVLDKIK